jgi:uncharacterized protein YndB with AHSA1/START domain
VTDDGPTEAESPLIIQDSSPIVRELRDHPDGMKTIVIRRSFSAPVEKVFAALTEPRQMIRWYLPLDGDLREGGYYVLMGNAVGEIYRCRPPRDIAVSWVYGDFESRLAMRLSPIVSGSRLTLAHGPVPLDMVTNPTPELWGLAVNWEMALSGLDRFLADDIPDGPAIEWLGRQSAAEREAIIERGRLINEHWLVAAELSQADLLSRPNDS